MSRGEIGRVALDHGATHRFDHSGLSVAAEVTHSAPGLSTPADATAQRAGELLLIAAGVVGRRHALGRYPELTLQELNGVVNTLTAIGVGELGQRGDRVTAVALAHRILDDDHPERTVLWGRMTRS